MTGRARTHAGAAARRSNDYRPENGPLHLLSPICTEPGRRPAPPPSPAPERPGHNAVVTRTLACAWPSLNGAPTVAAHATATRPCSSNPGRRRPVTAGPGERQRRALASRRGSGRRQAPRRLSQPRQRRAAGVADHNAGLSRACRCALLARSGSLIKSGPTPAFVLARVCAPAAQAWLPVSERGSQRPS